MKKFLSIILSLCLVFTFTSNVFAANSTFVDLELKSVPDLPEAIDANGFRMETVKNTKENQKIKFTNKETGEVEYIESILENGKYSYISTSNAGKQKVENVDGKIRITNLNTKEVKYVEQEDITTNNTNPTQKNLSIQYSVDDIDWIYDKTVYSSISTQFAQVSLVASIIASVAGGPVAGIILSIATYVIGESIDNMWYMKIYDHGYYIKYNVEHEAFLFQTYWYDDKYRSNLVEFMTFDTYTWSYNG